MAQLKTFFFVRSRIDVAHYQEPRELFPDIWLRKASDSEIDEFVRYYQNFSNRALFPGCGVRSYYEVTHHRIQSEEGTPESYSIKLLPKEKWKYWGFEIPRGSTPFDIHTIHTALQLNWPAISVGLQIVDNPDGSCSFAEYIFRPETPGLFEMPYSTIELTEKDIEQLITVCKQLKALAEVSPVHVALETYHFAVEMASPSRRYGPVRHAEILMFFSAIESLLTHKPDPKFPKDSIGGQIRENMLLLRDHFESEESCFNILGKKYAKPKDYTKLWDALYDIRSCISHGSPLDYSKNPLKRLKDVELPSVVEFLKLISRELILLTLAKPSFMENLRTGQRG